MKSAFFTEFGSAYIFVQIFLFSLILGSAHRLVDIQLFVADFLDKINDMKVWIFDKEEYLLGIVKQLTRILSDWDNDTETMIAELHEARDRHVSNR